MLDLYRAANYSGLQSRHNANGTELMARHDDRDDDSENPSYRQRKRDAEDLQKLGEEIIKLTKAQREQIPMPENLRDAIEDAATMTARGALKRQQQLVGKIMRDVDPAPIRAAIASLHEYGNISALRFRFLEQWRDRLVAEGDTAVGDALVEFPTADRNQLRQLIRSAQREFATQQPPKSARALFRYLRDLADEDADR